MAWIYKRKNSVNWWLGSSLVANARKGSEPRNKKSNPALAGTNSWPRRRPAGRKPRPCIDETQTTQAVIQIVREVFSQLNDQLNQLPDPRRQDLCRYRGAHIGWTITGTYFFCAGSRNDFDEKRNGGEAPRNLGDLCGQPGDDWRFEGKPTVTCSDNAALQAGRVDPDEVHQIPLWMVRQLLKRRLFDGMRLFDRWYVVLVVGNVQEKRRKGFEQLTVMISGTTLDLPEHRQQVVEACLREGIFPIGMEHLPARSLSGWTRPKPSKPTWPPCAVRSRWISRKKRQGTRCSVRRRPALAWEKPGLVPHPGQRGH